MAPLDRDTTVVTPLRRQYTRIKQRYPDALLLFRMGDFYETFDQDAHTLARELEIALTSREMGRGQRVPLAGIPYHSLEGHLARLVRKGYKVAICEQLSDPAASPGLVERDVVRVVTPGTLLEPSLLEETRNNYLVALAPQDDQVGLAYADVTTGELAVTQLPRDSLALELDRLGPAEVVLPEGQDELSGGHHITVSWPQSPFQPSLARQHLLDHFGVLTLEGYGCDDLPLAIGAAGAVLDYLEKHQKESLARFTGLTTYSTQRFMALDVQTHRNLELFQGGRWGGSAPSLYSVLNLTHTPMGARLLRTWLGQPLLDLAQLDQRLDAVAWCHADAARRQRLDRLLAGVSDMERLVNRVRSGVAVPRELLALHQSLESLPDMRSLLEEGEDTSPVAWLAQRLFPCSETAALLAQAIASEPGQLGEGAVIREGFSPELDQLRQISRDARGYIAGLERQERERTGIRSLKVGYNRVFGYYIEVSNPNLSQVPDQYQRRQTLVGAERFITPELKEHESAILSARERLEEMETTLYRQVCRQVGEAAPQVLASASAVAHLDVFAALAEVADRYGYARPFLDEGHVLEIRDGRHPVVERSLPPGAFVPNDTLLSNDDAQLVVLTGPNMAGKSTYIRQVALIVLMAQVGSFVPARSATVGLVDRIFTRVGLQDDLSTGQSTFMVEMAETATILNSATSRSLVVLDEIGRGTSTYDGLSIARAVAEHIHNSPRLRCKTLFATHYHELTELARTLPRARNYTVAVAEEEGRVAFLHRIVPGGADRSYGVHVAQLAGLPRDVVHRAWEVLEELERMRSDGTRRRRRRLPEGAQLPLPTPGSELLEELKELDVTSMTPLEAINALYALQQRAQEGRT